MCCFEHLSVVVNAITHYTPSLQWNLTSGYFMGSLFYLPSRPLFHISNTPTLGRRKRSQRGRGASILLAYFPLSRANYLFRLLYPLIWPVNSVTSAVEFSWVVVRSQELQKSEASTDLGKAVRHWQEKLEDGQGKCTQVCNMASKGMTSSQWMLWGSRVRKTLLSF